MIHTLKNLDYMKIVTPYGVFFGGSQNWYDDRWQRASGCGPTAAANLIWYHSRAGADLGGGYNNLQKEMFNFVTPCFMGVYSAPLFVDGVRKYAKAHGMNLNTVSLQFPKLFIKRPDAGIIRDFLSGALNAGCPVAFLNLSNGNQRALESWHWTTITAFDDESLTVSISDHGKALDIDIGAWRKTSLLGGSMVYLNIDDEL
ncbi:MAG: hypothetical protein FWE91_11905 [Defluviitaleaceae bacterium]|nr:hypothetical protein [Defluviitaleaceae bacterium]MCL2836743.1 hypothetical protein [Defluviitaleaceae bacterium]